VAPSAPTVVTAHRSHEQASKSSIARIRTAYRAGLRRVRNTKRIADKIGCAERLERLKRVIEVSAPVLSDIYRLATAEVKGEARDQGGIEAFRQRRER
jgi:hypothetical protein